MNTIQVKSTKDKVLITIDKKTVDKDFLAALLERFRAEFLASKTDFGAEIVDMGEEIKKTWWTQAGKRYLKG